MLRAKLLISLTIIILMSGLVAGATTAWFVSNVTLNNITFTAGTVQVSSSDISIDESSEYCSDDPACRKVIWDITNTGSKAVFLRAKHEGYGTEGECHEESAWAGAVDVDEKDHVEEFTGANWAMYFEAVVGEDKEVDFVAGQHHDIGNVSVSTGIYEGEEVLMITVKTEGGWTMEELHAAVVDDKDIFEKEDQKSAPGQFPFKVDGLGDVTEYTFNLPLSGTYPRGSLEGQTYNWTVGEPIFIAVQGKVNRCIPGGDPADVEWELCDDSDWVEGSDGWWYYCEEPLQPEETIRLCFIVRNLFDQYSAELELEAIQSSNNAISVEWPGNPCGQ